MGRLLTSAAFVTVVAALVTVVLTGHLDDERMEREAESSEERSEEAAIQAASNDWRARLADGGRFPGAQLAGLDLTGVYARDVDLSGAAASDVDLSRATLPESRFDGADLTGASLRGAQLGASTFTGADLGHADLSHATLWYADLRHADLAGADLRGAMLMETDLRGVDLSAARLDTDLSGLPCWDEGTRWPEGVVARSPACAAPRDRPPPASELYRADLFAAPSADLHSWSRSTSVEGEGTVSILAYFTDTGRTVLRNVTVYIRAPAIPGLSIRARDVQLRNSNHPDGYKVDPTAVQDDGRAVHLGIGHYASGGGAYVSAEYDIVGTAALGCGPWDLTFETWATPEGRGASYAEAQVRWSPPGC